MMTQVQKEREQKKKKEEEEKLVKDKEFDLMNKKMLIREEFAREVIRNENAIKIVFRMPNMNKVEKIFDRESRVRRLYEFVSVCENNGMEKVIPNFEITQTFPRLVLNPDVRIKEVFGNSDAEMVNVFEVNE